MSWKCGVYVNHAYRVLFLRNRKAASSSIFTALGESAHCAALALNEKGSCFQPWSPENATAAGYDPDQVWNEYLVVSQSRNPWARAASGYEYCLRLWGRHDYGCRPPSFSEFTRDPYILGKLSNTFNCAPERHTTAGRPDHWHHDFYHVEPAHHCFTDDEGRNAVDYIVRYERLEEDMEQLVELINARLPSDGSVPRLAPRRLRWEKRGTTARQERVKDPGEAPYMHARAYRQCGWECVDALQRFAAGDLAFFGWERAAEPPPGIGNGAAAAVAAAGGADAAAAAGDAAVRVAAVRGPA